MMTAQITDLNLDRKLPSDSPGFTPLPEIEDPESTLKLIDKRQDLVLEDLERLNQRIINIIEVCSNNRSNAGADTSRDAA